MAMKQRGLGLKQIQKYLLRDRLVGKTDLKTT
jgi:hypothetical protein